MYDASLAETVRFPGAGGDLLEGYAARPMDGASRGGVVVIHHLPGYDRETKEFVRRFAVMGFNAVCPNLYTRLAPGASPDDAAAVARAQGGVADEQVVGDVAGAVHAFFSVDRPAYRVEAALDGWVRIQTFLDQHLAG